MAKNWLADSLLPLIGWEFKSTEKEEEKRIPTSPVVPTNEDAAYPVYTDSFGKVVYPISFDSQFDREDDLIKKYRAIAAIPEVDTAIDEIVNDAIVTDEESSPVQINTDDLNNFPDSIKEKIKEEFENILRMLDFNLYGSEIFRKWYIDGRLYYHILIDPQNSSEGIKELRPISPFEIRKIREIKKKRIGAKSGTVEVVEAIKEYFQYSPRFDALYGTSEIPYMSSSNVSLNLSKDSVCFVHSGLLDDAQNIIYGYLHKAMRVANMLGGMEDAMVIYRLVRAPERRIFYIDTGSLPPRAAEQRVTSVANKYRNRTIWDPQTGEIQDQKRVLSMMEDYFLIRQEGSKGTQVDTLPGASNLSDIGDVEYFSKKLYKALNVPPSRLQENEGFSLGRASEISREELKFSKFISKLRKRFSGLFYSLLRTQLLLKQIISKEDWEEISENISFDFQKDSHIAELKEIDIMRERLATLQQMDAYIGVYFSKEYVRKHVLRLTDQDIEAMEKQMEKEAREEPKMVPGQQNDGQDAGTPGPFGGGMPPGDAGGRGMAPQPAPNALRRPTIGREDQEDDAEDNSDFFNEDFEG